MTERLGIFARTGLLLAGLAAPGLAGAVESSPRPLSRPDAAAAPMRLAMLNISPRPRARPLDEREVQRVANSGFQGWIRSFRPRALAAGVSPSTFARAFDGIHYNTDVISRDRNQSEFTKQIWDYLDSAVSDTRVSNGREAYRRHRSLLREIEARYKVDAHVVTAIWGLESAYGSHKGRTPIVEALATLAYDGRRGRFFEQQLVAALKIIESGDTAPRDMTGSWAGAMGHTQFIPTSYLAYAQDFRGDGRRGIWGEDPTDGLASTANYLARHGWAYGHPWGMEVTLPRGFDYALAGERVKKSAAEWTRMGVRTADGRAVPDFGRASILLPAGARGAAFVIYKNFHVIERYNAADAYVIAVGHLGDRIRGAGALRAGWPRNDRGLSVTERKEMQQRLTARGYDTQGVDGIIGPNTIAAVRAFQASQGMVPDGYTSLEILRRLR
ncbi:lytic murein transglycosylase [Maritimibacter sp. 55A14]|uniref:lytic murein transglycosylase n=1 Tax=Maritimibacter sp. 55A14 TaxID=2174844 RepID=UPI000D61403C|nr:lytic murein transglycosylase [Maritimibacter sp. 55A14]PWE32673.1 lytic murein transglycosylase [Maritimibacter sp. 55A14]